VSYQDFENIIKVIGDRNLEYFEKLNDKNCGEQRETYGLSEENIRQVSSTEGKNGPAVMAAIDEQLDKGNISAVAFPFKMISTSDTGGHSVTLVGRRFNEKTKTCEYLLRNSWGLTCGGSLKKELCAPEHPGHLWVSRGELEKNLWRVTYIE
jgi:C1A family cysteine protease